MEDVNRDLSLLLGPAIDTPEGVEGAFQTGNVEQADTGAAGSAGFGPSPDTPMGTKGDRMSEPERARLIAAMENAPRPAFDESNERPAPGMSKDYVMDNNRTLRYHGGNIEAYVTFLRNGKRTEKVGWVNKPYEILEEVYALNEIYEMAIGLNAKTLHDLYAIEQTVYRGRPELLERTRKRRREGFRTPTNTLGANTPGAGPAPMAPGMGPMRPFAGRKK